MDTTSEAIVTIDQIIDSLHRRGFYTGAGIREAQTQVDAVLEELGEVARFLRRYRQGIKATDLHAFQVFQDETADVVIAAVCLGAAACGSQLSEVIARKLATDEARGHLHNG